MDKPSNCFRDPCGICNKTVKQDIKQYSATPVSSGFTLVVTSQNDYEDLIKSNSELLMFGM